MLTKLSRKPVLLILLVFTFLTNACADEADNAENDIKRTGLGIYVDQDFFFPILNEDRDYTMGVAFEIFWKDKPERLRALDEWLQKINGKMYFTKGMTSFQRSLMIGSINYTPDDLANPNPIFDDRPYSSLIYLSSKRVFAKACPEHYNGTACKEKVIGTELQVGWLGLDITEEVQTSIHTNMRQWSHEDEPLNPKGWRHQISDGGEPTLKYRASCGEQLLKNHYGDLAYTADASAGYQTNVSFGLQTRLGLRNSGFWTLPYDPINRGSFIPSKDGNERYFWTVYRARGVLYDASLQGQFRNSDVTFGSSDIERIVFESGVGLTCAYKRLQVTLSANFKSSELKGTAQRSHWWGGLYLVFMP